MTSQPIVDPFTYVLIPADDAKPVEERRFEGKSDGELRHMLQRYFRHQLLSRDQELAMKRHLVAKSEEAARKQAAQGDTADATAKTPVQHAAEEELRRQQQDHMIEQYLDNTSYEIVPVVMPMRETHYVGTSLYVDDSGSFKDLPLNSRASTVAQRDIRGDAFLLSNRDDPALDEWARTDCTAAAYEHLHAHPPKQAYDTADRAQMNKTALLRDADSKRISEADIEAAAAAKTAGNAHFAKGDTAAALQAYTTVVELTEGRRDLLADEAAATALRVTALLNRSLCYVRQGQTAAAATDARTAAHLDPASVKAQYRLAQALLADRDYDAAEPVVQRFVELGGDEASATALQQQLAEGRRQLKAEMKKKFSKMFA
ncbi:malate dehydrogenase (quinone) [Strigomonas culicis]|uniref:Malate dehydrogenase (Quinone) n=1 Tax=Strigomonas culicis TaxID=28005 RepID=S9UW85_9TRYP|nr:malate dehydrogenase (quinone) [Strigomonas culicis]EPY33128.1 malate dehydrogenase (quinone) [Strigomonas culicis]|eukprot:EPY32412.1 malate dehydrogenase (quinone) [Strigomonas culicis]